MSKDLNNEVDTKPIRPNDPWETWNNEVAKLCYDIFFASEKGKRLLMRLEHRYFYSPVAVPGQPDMTFLNEGRNELIRTFRLYAQNVMLGIEKTSKPKDVIRTKKDN